MDRASDFLLWASIGLPLGMTAVGPERSGRDTAVLAGTFAVNILVVDAVKRLADRPRPFAHFCEPPSLADLRGEDAHFSFYSGHASTAFAMAVFAGRLADSRRYSGTTRALVWTAGLSMAASTAALRVAADKHYLIDVTVGAAAGTLVGLAASKLHKPRGSPSPSAARPVVTIPVPLGSRTVVGIDGRGRPSLRASWRW
jgi:membrane-associated phospholipid phosphatase